LIGEPYRERRLRWGGGDRRCHKIADFKSESKYSNDVSF
jgi:hypothetical protein